MAPEIYEDEFYYAITSMVMTYKPKVILEIGSGEGMGSTQAFIDGIAMSGIKKDVKLYCVEIDPSRSQTLERNLFQTAKPRGIEAIVLNGSTGGESTYMGENEVRDFMLEHPEMPIRQYTMNQVLGWRKEEIEKVRLAEEVLAPWDFVDMVLLDGSPFTGLNEFIKCRHARVIMLDDTNDIKNWHNYTYMLADSAFKLIQENQKLRNGYAIFERLY